MHNRTRAITLVILVLSLAIGFGAIEPTATPIPPTNTPLPPAAILVLPTQTKGPSNRSLPPTAMPTSAPANIPTPVETPEPAVVPLSLISQDRLFASLEELMAIQPYSGWRNSATEGEAEALEYVANTLEELAYLQGLGLQLERESFHVFLATELWETRLYLTTQGQETEGPPMPREVTGMILPRLFVSTRMVSSTIRNETRS